MAPKVSKTSGEPTLYDILSLTPKHLEGQTTSSQQKTVKTAYHKALLRHHPDKNASNNGSAESPTSSPPTPQDSQSASKSTSKSPSPQNKNNKREGLTYTIDQIQHAYSILSDLQKRKAYNLSLSSSSSSFSSSKHRVLRDFHFSSKQGVETVDLDDCGFDERKGVYYRGCRCGNRRGYLFTEDNLEEFEDDGVLMVECLDCSLWLRVLFTAAVEDDHDQAQGQAQQQQHQQAQTRNGQVPNGNGKKQMNSSSSSNDSSGDVAARQRNQNGSVASKQDGGEVTGKKEGKGWTFNFSFGLGVSLGGGASASRGADPK